MDLNNRCAKLVEWLRLVKGFQVEEEALKASMPKDRRRILESKKAEIDEVHCRNRRL